MATATFTHLSWEPTVKSVTATFDCYAEQSPVGAYPALGAVPLAEIRDAFRSPGQDAWKDLVLMELIQAAQAGDALAHITVIRLLIPKAIKVTASSRALRLYSLDDALSIYITALWEAILTHPVTRNHRIAFSLAMDALGIVNGSVKRSNRKVTETSMDNFSDEELESYAFHEDDADPERDLAEVLAWSLSAKILTKAEVILLTRYYLAGDVPSSRETLMEEHGVSAEALRKRASRIRITLVNAVRQEVSEAGWEA
ncbi:hypothetical protein [Arthrobacter cryoconiti]|uniref:Uncharacterized protein n=1 Tax=Arthrobacter cryoconiti TaxID=748907 RepID=A0ABV8R454_9MICC|nr:hypothetical protein [Arthrobacter cryoconiti]MCC9069345.1 hypothetical protein [Arthrobacter cryoconiti]